MRLNPAMTTSPLDSPQGRTYDGKRRVYIRQLPYGDGQSAARAVGEQRAQAGQLSLESRRKVRPGEGGEALQRRQAAWDVEIGPGACLGRQPLRLERVAGRDEARRRIVRDED